MLLPQENFSGILAIDIDGTITHSEHELHPLIKEHFENWARLKWHLIFLTGRTFTFAMRVLHPLQVSFDLAPQNGTSVIEMPGQKGVLKRYLNRDVFRELGKGFLIEAGVTQGDKCYFCSADFTPDELNYLEYRKKISGSVWIDLESWEQLPLQEFAVAKFFGTLESVLAFAKKITTAEVTIIRDVFRLGFYLAHVHAKGSGKEQALEFVMKLRGKKGPLIAAGDDFNDLEMLKRADYAIVPLAAPKEVQEVADMTPESVLGVADAINDAVKRCMQR